MAWQSGPSANGGNAVPGPEATGVQAYTLQGKEDPVTRLYTAHAPDRCHAISPDRMASS